MRLAWAAGVALALLVQGCAPSRPRLAPTVIERALATPGTVGTAHVGDVVAVELAYARRVAEDGLNRADRRYRAENARIWHDGGLSDAIAPASFAPRLVVMSCDGRTAAVQGRQTHRDGKVGDYVRLWERGRDGDWRWLHAVSGPDVPQPPPPEPDAELGPNDIVVTAYDRIEGLIASCTAPGASPASIDRGGANLASVSANDGTLRWQSDLAADGAARVTVAYWHDGDWHEPIAETFSLPDRP